MAEDQADGVLSIEEVLAAEAAEIHGKDGADRIDRYA